MFLKKSFAGYLPAIDKIDMKTLVYGEKTLMSEFHLRKGALLPRHSHPHEQTGYLLTGKMEMTIGNETFTVESGDSWCIPGQIEHNVRVLEDSIAVEVFSPVREDYLP
ncbi:MAG: cupin domain-containing protein [Deltaproteobacteria bacterium]|jgi:quercetin dioxygenase-like cupin family protein|nr:cupin domain-containing protein [Deltaproteobacteria bacterium]MCW8892204.1 cupin domain-containing protein [Deltaproteobacteria bacterium]MCW9050027.1 cupin domain-containing protein [Deltaproteobacteria bacterium]